MKYSIVIKGIRVKHEDVSVEVEEINVNSEMSKEEMQDVLSKMNLGFGGGFGSMPEMFKQMVETKF